MTWLLTPAMAGLLLFVLLPFLLALILSFTNMRLGSPLGTEFVGLEQFRRLMQQAGFWHALSNNILFAFIVVPVQTVLALVLAMLCNQALAGMALFRTLFFMPVVFPLSLVAVVWVLIFAPGSDGMMNHVLQLLSFRQWQPRDFLHDRHWALPAIMLTSIWQGAGFQMVILLAALQGIPSELYESASIDGAGSVQRFWHITLPQLRNALIFTVLVTTILSFRLFDQVQVMTQGGPLDATTTLMYEAVTAAFQRQQVAYGSAITVVLFVFVLVITLLQRRLLRQSRELE